MNTEALIGGKRFEFIQIIKNIINNKDAVLCKDECGIFAFCDIDDWKKNKITENNSKPNCIDKYSSPQEKIELFKHLFIGRTDVYAKRYYSTNTGKSGYVPACSNEWIPNVCDKKANTCTTCPNRNFVKLTDKIIYDHLSGKDDFCRDVIGVYPMMPNESTKFLAIDFDDDNWQKDVSAVKSICMNLNIPVAVERSRSGNGAHMWFFFEEPVSATDARKLGSGILTTAMESRHEIGLDSYDRMFPNQDSMPKGGFGNLIALPLQGKARKSCNSVFVDESFIPYPDQWEYLSNIEKISNIDLEKYIKQLCKKGELGELCTDEEKPWIKNKPITISAFDFANEVEIIKSNMLYINEKGISQSALNKIKRLAAFKNPDFYKSQAMRLPVYNKPRIISTSEETNNYLCIPRGCEESLIDLLKELNVKFITKDERSIGNPINLSFHGQLRDEQQLAVNEMLKYENGVLSATTAFGKTVIASYIISERKVNTLILVHSSALLSQWEKSLKEFLIFNEALPEQIKKRGRRKKLSHIGLLGSGKNTINGIVDVAIMQSMFNKDEVKDLIKNYGMIIVDECHHISAFSFEKVLKEANAKYVYGLTATPVRQDGHHPIIFMQCGPIRYKVDARLQADKREFSHFIVPRFTEFRVMDEADYQSVCGKLIYNEMRNKMIVNDALKIFSQGRNPIILTERTEHTEILSDMLSDKCKNLFLLNGKDKTKVKKEKLETIKAVPENENIIIVATGKYVGEGFDEPRLDTLLLAMPVAWKGTLAQYAGRLHRNYIGKREVLVYDYADVFVPMLDRMYHKRVKGYAELGYSIKAFDGVNESIIYDSKNYFDMFSRDIKTASKEIIIASPLIKKSSFDRLLNVISNIDKLNVKIIVATKPIENYPEKEQGVITEIFQLAITNGINILQDTEIHQCFAIIDKSILWYGNVSFLSYNYSTESTLRIIDETIAGKMREVVIKEKTFCNQQ